MLDHSEAWDAAGGAAGVAGVDSSDGWAVGRVVSGMTVASSCMVGVSTSVAGGGGEEPVKRTRSVQEPAAPGCD